MYWLLRNIRVTTYDRNSVITRDPNKIPYAGERTCARKQMDTKRDQHRIRAEKQSALIQIKVKYESAIDSAKKT